MPLELNTIYEGDCLEVLKTLPDEAVNCVVTSPPYWGLRDYGCAGQIGLEKTPEEFIEKMVVLFREVRRVLRKDGTLWLNLGDSYNGSGNPAGCRSKRCNGGQQRVFDASDNLSFRGKGIDVDGLKPKDLCGIPWRVALALQADGWYLRQDIIWAKPNPMPESVTDRCTKSHEYIFLLTKSPKYWYDAEAIKENAVETNDARPRMGQGPNTQYNQKRNHFRNSAKYVNQPSGVSNDNHEGNRGGTQESSGKRNRRSVWTVPTQAYSEAHFATFPEKLIEPCILAGCPKEVCPKCGKARVRIVEKSGGSTGKSWHDHSNDLGGGMSQTGKREAEAVGGDYKVETIGFTDCGCGVGFQPGVVLDPFMGSGTVGYVAAVNQRDYIGIELNTKYIEMAKRRIGEAETGVTVKEQKAGQKALWT